MAATRTLASSLATCVVATASTEGLNDFRVGLDFRPCLEVLKVIRVLFLPELGDGIAPHLWVRIAEREEIERRLDGLAKF